MAGSNVYKSILSCHLYCVQESQMHTGTYKYFTVWTCYFDLTWLAEVLWKVPKAQSHIQHWQCVNFTIYSSQTWAVRFSLKQRDDKHKQKRIKGTSYSVSLAKHHAWRTEFCEGWFSPTDMNDFPSDNGRTGRRSKRKSTKPTWNCQLFPEAASFLSLSGLWERASDNISENHTKKFWFCWDR